MMWKMTTAVAPLVAMFTFAMVGMVFAGQSGPADLYDRVKHGYAISEGGVKIHYASLGDGPLVVMIHGFPDFWYSWRSQMEALSERYQVVAIDQRGYNLSDKPKGVENYDMRLLVGDVAAVIKHLGRDKATIVGHDWGGAVAWQFAIEPPADDGEPDHPQSAASERPGARTAIESAIRSRTASTHAISRRSRRAIRRSSSAGR